MSTEAAAAGERRAGTALVTGATGFIGGRLARLLASRGWRVRCLVRDPSRAEDLAKEGMELVVADLLDGESLRGAGEGVDVAYYLVHAMGRGGGRDFEDRERRAAHNFAEMASREGVGRMVYLGGLGDQPRSRHLRSRQLTAEVLAEHGPPLLYLRAAMVVGAGSESYRTLRYLVQRLPAMIAPSWLSIPTQPIGIDDAIEYLARAPVELPPGSHEVQIGGPDVLSYGEMLDRMAEALGIRPRWRIPVPFLTPKLSSLWIGLVTPVDAGVARLLIESLSTPTVVTDPAPAQQLDVSPIGFTEALRRAVAEDEDSGAGDDVAVHLLPEERWPVPVHGPAEGVSSAQLVTEMPIRPDRDLVARAGEAYWGFITRRSLGLFRSVRRPDGSRYLVLVGKSLELIGFAPPRFDESNGGASVTWPIADGPLVSNDHEPGGFLRLTLQPAGPRPEHSLIATLEVRGFYPAIRGEGRLAGLRALVYGATQRRVHRAFSRGFLRALPDFIIPLADSFPDASGAGRRTFPPASMEEE